MAERWFQVTGALCRNNGQVAAAERSPGDFHAGGPTSTLTEAGVRFVSRYGTIAVVLAWVVTRGGILTWGRVADPGAGSIVFADLFDKTTGDLHLYFDLASAWLGGKVPYRNLALEYPPGALMLFTFPRLFVSTFDTYAIAFGFEMLAFDALALWLLTLLPGLLRGRGSARNDASLVERAVVGLGYVALTSCMGQLLVQRFDDIVVRCADRRILSFARSRGACSLAEALLALGVWVKLTPAALVPVYLVMLHAHAAARDGSTGEAPSLARWLFHTGWRPAGRIAAFKQPSSSRPSCGWRARAWRKSFDITRRAAYSLESLPASALAFVQALRPIGANARMAFGSVEIEHPAAHALTAASGIAVVVALAALAVVSAWRLRAQPGEDRDVFLRGAVASLLGAMALAKVFSPAVSSSWVATATAGAAAPPRRAHGRHRRCGGVRPGRAGLFAFDYSGLERDAAVAHRALLLTRNLAVLWLASGGWRGDPAHRPTRRSARARTCCRWRVLGQRVRRPDRTLRRRLDRRRQPDSAPRDGEYCGPTCASAGRSRSTTRSRSTDLFTAPWSVGRAFRRTRVALGRRVRYRPPARLGGRPVPAPAPAVGRAPSCCWARCRARRVARGRPCPRLLLGHARDLGVPRMCVTRCSRRPALAALTFALERWRRSGQLRELVWLIPMQVLWANLDSAALAAPLLVGVLAAVASRAAVRDSLRPQTSGAALTARDTRVPLGSRDAAALSRHAAIPTAWAALFGPPAYLTAKGGLASRLPSSTSTRPGAARRSSSRFGSGSRRGAASDPRSTSQSRCSRRRCRCVRCASCRSPRSSAS